MNICKKTRYIEVDLDYPEPEAISEAAAVIRNGGTVAFPTETVYGLGANGLDPVAVEGIYAAKGRPRRNPLILHVASIEQARLLVKVWTPLAERLAASFWPGPLTLILPRAAVVPEIVTAGLDNVALRMPAHPVALALIERSGVPIAAPSANASGRPSPTLAEHVRADLDSLIDLVLDGGPAVVGVESTILALNGECPLLLRPGGVTREALERVVGTVRLHETARPGAAVGDAELDGGAAPCPGTMFRHYAPRAEALVVTGDSGDQIDKVRDYLTAHPDRRVALLATVEAAPVYLRMMRGDAAWAVPAAPIHMEVVGSRSRPEDVASNIFGALRNCDQAGAEVILMEAIPLSGLGLAVMNRLYRAAANRTI